MLPQHLDVRVPSSHHRRTSRRLTAPDWLAARFTNKTPRIRAVTGFVGELVAKHREAIEGRASS
jgi:hypothetical protein